MCARGCCAPHSGCWASAPRFVALTKLWPLYTVCQESVGKHKNFFHGDSRGVLTRMPHQAPGRKTGRVI